MKKIVKAVSVTALVALASACTWKIPETVSVRTKAEYNFALGDVKKSLSDIMSAKKIMEEINKNIGSSDSSSESGSSESGSSGSSGAEESQIKVNIYDYDPEDDPNEAKRFLADLAVKKIELDIGEMLPENMDFESALGDKLECPVDIPEVEIPDLNEYLKKDMEIDLPDFSSEMLGKISFKVDDFTILDNPELNGKAPVGEVPIEVKTGTSGEGAEEKENKIGAIGFSAGSLDLTVTPRENTPAGMEVKLVVKMQCSFDDGVTYKDVATSGTPVTLSSTAGQAAVIQLPLTGKEITTKVKLSFEGSSFQSSTDNQMANNYYKYAVNVDFSDDANISQISGVTMELENNSEIAIADDQGNPYKIDAVDNDMFMECKIGEGSLYLTCAEPEGWTGVTFTPELTITGGLTAGTSDFREIPNDDEHKDYYTANAIMNKELVLDGKAYAKDEIFISGNIHVKIEDATFVFNDSAKKIVIHSTGVVRTIDDVAVNLKSVLTDSETGESRLNYDVTYDLDESGTNMSDYVSYIDLEDFGINLPYSNTFPSNATFKENGEVETKSTINTISVGYYSKFFGFGSKTGDVITYDGTEIYSWGDKTIQKNDENGVPQTVNYLDTISLIKEGKTTILPEENHIVDVSLKLTLPGHDAVADADFISKYGADPDFDYFAIFKGIKPGTKYSIKMEKPLAEMNWTKAGIKKSVIGENLNNSVDTGIDMSSMLSSFTEELGDQNFVDNLLIKELPIYLYCVMPDLTSLKEMGLGGTIIAQTIDKTDEQNPVVTHEEVLLGEETSQPGEGGTVVTNITPETLTTVDSIPELDTQANLEAMKVTKKLSTNPTKVSIYKKDAIAKLINSHAKGALNLAYNISLGGNEEYFDVTRKQFDELKNKANSENKTTSITIHARMILPMRFEVAPDEGQDEVTIDIMGLINKSESKDSSESSSGSGNSGENGSGSSEGNSGTGTAEASSDKKDLFGRDEATNLDDIKVLLDILNSVSIDYSLTNDVLKYNNGSNMSVEMDTKIDAVGKKQLSLGNNKSLQISSDDFTEMMKTYPFYPDLKAHLPAGEVYMPKNASITANVKIKIKTDGEVKLFGGDDALMGGN